MYVVVNYTIFPFFCVHCLNVLWLNSGVLCFPFGSFIYWKYLYRSCRNSGGCGISLFHISDDDDGQLKPLVFAPRKSSDENLLRKKIIFKKKKYYCVQGSQYSGNTTGDDEFNASCNDLENSKSDRQPNHNLIPEESEDENSIDFRCVVCEKQFPDLET